MAHNDEDSVLIGYESPDNSSFEGSGLELGYTWGDWRKMTSQEQADALTAALWELVQVYVEDDES